MLCCLLYKGNTGFNGTTRIIHTLTVYVIMSGMTTALLNSATLVSYLVAPSNLSYQLFEMCVSEAYVNTLMATLNSRASLRGLPSQTISGLTTNTAEVIPPFRAPGVSSNQSRSEYELRTQKAAAITHSDRVFDSEIGGKSMEISD